MQVTNSMPVSTLGFLDECHEIVLKHLRPQIKKMFESSDLAFLEFAEKAQSNASQLRFFEAMTVIQVSGEKSTVSGGPPGEGVKCRQPGPNVSGQ